MGWNFDTQSRTTRSRRPHFGGLYSRGPHLPDHHKTKSRPRSRPGPDTRSQKSNAKAHSSHRWHHHSLCRRSLPSRRRFRSHNQRPDKRARPIPTRPRISITSGARNRHARHWDITRICAQRGFSSCYLAALCYFSSALPAGHIGLHLNYQCLYLCSSVLSCGALDLDFLTRPYPDGGCNA